jgi:hypothetical protein
MNTTAAAAEIASLIPEMAHDSTTNNSEVIETLLKRYLFFGNEGDRVPQYDAELDAADKLITSLKIQVDCLQKALSEKHPSMTGVMLQCALAAMRSDAASSQRARFTALLQHELETKPWLL